MNQRNDLVALAKDFNIDGADSMKLDELRREIVRAHQGNDADVDRMDSNEVKGAVDIIRQVRSDQKAEYEELSGAMNDRRDAGGSDDRVSEAQSDYEERLYG
jgi:hypothetical protein